MDNTPQDYSRLLERLERLEVQNARLVELAPRLKWTAAATGLVALLSVAISFANIWRGSIVRAGRFVVVDENGVERSVWSVNSNSDSPFLALRDDKGMSRAEVALGADGSPAVRLCDKTGKRRVGSDRRAKGDKK